MTTHLTTWLLGGALAASLFWNVRGALAPSQPPATCAPTACTPSGCEDALAGLDLTDSQRAALAEWSATSCRASARVDAEAAAKADELFAALAAPELDPSRARRLAAETSELRAQALAACVESLLVVRRHLTPAQVEALLASCCAPPRR
ncbi:MAG: Spy/CpxP family protein refolding chaperone [Planctomycetes bacterium]|nr:Spy/CpxP family protein refolding chaperone [Planctomycetota bacterium]